jgi:hypothetical protein
MAVTHADWETIRAQGVRRYVAIGAVRHGLLMGAAVVVLLELFSGHDFSQDRLASREFLLRVALCFAVFSLSGAVSAYARWRGYESVHDRLDRG